MIYTMEKECLADKKFYCESHFCRLEIDSDGVYRCMNAKKIGGACRYFMEKEK